MDIFGIGVRILNSVHEHARLAKGTGRSYVLSDMAMPGDCIVFATREHQQEFLRLHRQRGRPAEEIECVVSEPRLGVRGALQALANKRAQFTRVFVDHAWLEMYYAKVVSDSATDLLRLNQMFGNREGGI